jgi:hypothetical protein
VVNDYVVIDLIGGERLSGKHLQSLILNAIHLNSLNPRNNMLTQDARSQTRAGPDTPQ